MKLVVTANTRFFIEANADQAMPMWLLQIKGEFLEDASAGLLLLPKHPKVQLLSESFQFWYSFAALFIRHLSLNGLRPSSSEEHLVYLSKCVVPLGREFHWVDLAMLRRLWQMLEGRVQRIITTEKISVTDFITREYNEWQNVGKIHFHLAEQQKDKGKPFAFMATCATVLSSLSEAQHYPLAKAIKVFSYAGQENIKNVLKPLLLASQKSAVLKRMLESEDVFKVNHWTLAETLNFLQDIPVYEEAGIVVKVPEWWVKKRPRRIHAQLDLKVEEKSFVGIRNLIDFDLSFVLGHSKLGKDEIEKILARNEDLIYINNQWIEVDRKNLTRVLEKWQQATELWENGLSLRQAFQIINRSPFQRNEEEATFFLNGEEQDFFEINFDDKLSRHLRELLTPEEELIEPIATQTKKDIKAQLRPYQNSGVNWLYQRFQIGMGGILADDMGLGKTLQLLCLINFLTKDKDQTKILLIVPVSLLSNWQKEIDKFCSHLSFAILHPAFMARDELLKEADKRKENLFITSYQMLFKVPWLKDFSWNLLIVDEAQALKNPEAQITSLLNGFSAQLRFALTGTPLENSVKDLWSLMQFVAPGVLGSLPSFLQNKTKPHFYESLRRVISPYILRRKKTDKKIISDLPEKTEIKISCLLTKKQIALYQSVHKDFVKELKSATPEDIKRKGLILKYLMAFKKIVNHPSQYLKDQSFLPEESGKFQQLIDIGGKVFQSSEKLLLFTQFRELTPVLHAILGQIFGREGVVLTGKTPAKKRHELIDIFQNDPAVPYFVLSLKAGGTGLNLTAANHVIHFDRWWNPAVENQATDRAFRIGQKNPVFVHKFISRGTIEEKIDLMLMHKTDLADEIIEKPVMQNIANLSDEDLLALFRLDALQSMED